MSEPVALLPELVEQLLDRHIQRCRDAVSECPKWSPAQAEWSRARDALLNFKDDLAAIEATQTDQQLREEVERLREALEPFAKFADHQDAYRRKDEDDFCATIISGATGERWRLTCGDLRRARSSLSSSSLSNG